MSNFLSKIENFGKTLEGIPADIAALLKKAAPVVNILNVAKTDIISVIENPIFITVFEGLFPQFTPEAQAVYTWLAANTAKINAAMNLGLDLTNPNMTIAQKIQELLSKLPTDAAAKGQALMNLATLIAQDITNGTLSAADAQTILQGIYNISAPVTPGKIVTN